MLTMFSCLQETQTSGRKIRKNYGLYPIPIPQATLVLRIESIELTGTKEIRNFIVSETFPGTSVKSGCLKFKLVSFREQLLLNCLIESLTKEKEDPGQ